MISESKARCDKRPHEGRQIVAGFFHWCPILQTVARNWPDEKPQESTLASWALVVALVLCLIVQSWQVRVNRAERLLTIQANNEFRAAIAELKAAVDQQVLINGHTTVLAVRAGKLLEHAEAQ